MVKSQQQQLKICFQVLAMTRDVEQGLEKKNKRQIQNKTVKQPF